jgi:hypothetical protein
MKNNGVTLAQYLDPVWREKWIRKTGFVDVLNLDAAKSERGITPTNGNSDIRKPELARPAEC